MRTATLLLFLATLGFSQARPFAKATKPFTPPPLPGTAAARAAARNPNIKSGFRQASWGATPEEVKKGEPLQLKMNPARPDMLYATSSIANMECFIFFEFANRRLVTGTYQIQSLSGRRLHTNDNEYLEDFGHLRDLLAEKYGPPSSDESDWSNPFYEDDPPHYGLALSMGHFTKKSTWRSDQTTISLLARGDNFRISIGVVYSSVALSGLAEKVRHARESSPF